MPDLYPSLKFLGFLTRTKPTFKMNRKIDNILNDIINDHKRKELPLQPENVKKAIMMI